MNINSDSRKENTFDAIVVGTGISGGWAAKELTEGGLNTLVLERGRNVRHVIDYPTMNKDSWELPYRDQLTAKERKDYKVQQRTGYTLRQSTKHWWVKDTDQPYNEKKGAFDWIRGYHVGGKSLMWSRHVYRWGEIDFKANAKDGIGIDWPIRYKDIEKWYQHVENFIGVSGMKEGLSQLPDGNFLPPIQMNCVEKDFKNNLFDKLGRTYTMGRVTNITKNHNGRGKCQSRNLCIRGCPHGAYFSSNSSTLPAAEATGNMTLKPNSIVHSIIYDDEKNKATGVRVIDSETMQMTEYYAKIIFLNASTINSTLIMLNSKSRRFPNGFGNDSGELGHNIMDHHFKAGARAQIDGYEDYYYYGNRPTNGYLARFRNLGNEKMDYVRGFGYQGGAKRGGWVNSGEAALTGENLLQKASTPGGWTMNLLGFGEILPYHDNRMYLDNEKLDKWGMPTVVFETEIKENEKKMREDMKNSASEMLEKCGFKNVKGYDNKYSMGNGIHEMGTARMGKDPKTSILNKWNQVHEAKNVFVTDGACMTSAGCVNPSITYMALTARAANYAINELKKRNL
jgi:choline dehydrogenase-like flavoprotein